jgi:transketolase
MDAVQRANSGHPGTPMAQAPAAYVLWTKFMKHNPANPNWVNRDRFILSCGHVSMLLYSVLYLSGYDLTLDDIKQFRQFGSKTPGHPERGHTPGVEITTGPLGQGIGNAVGMAVAERWLAERFNRPGFQVVNHYTFVFAGDGDIMEGVAQEAASLAGHLALDKIIMLYDNNHITIEGSTALSFTEDVNKRFEAYGWRVINVDDGENLEKLQEAFEEALCSCGKPTLINCQTVIGFPAPNKKNTAVAHGAPLGEEEVRSTKKILGWDPNSTFVVPTEALAEWRKCEIRGKKYEADWNRQFDKYRMVHADLAEELENMMLGKLPCDWDSVLPQFGRDKSLATREAGGLVLNALTAKIPNLFGGSADLNPSTNTYLSGCGDFGVQCGGRNIHWGIREHAMGAALNGISAHGGLHVFGATFFVFSDYMRPSIRLAGLMGLPVKYVWTHDSIGVGEDGPTHQPVEQLMSLRMIPNVTILRPADANETVEAWRLAINHTNGPVGLVLTRQKLPVLAPEKTKGFIHGGYVLEEASSSAKVLIVATGSEVHVALSARSILEQEGIPTRVVSMPCLEIFRKQSEGYRQQVLPSAVKVKICIEAGVTFGWEQIVGDGGVCIGINHFGSSAPAEKLFECFGFTAENVVATAKRML